MIMGMEVTVSWEVQVPILYHIEYHRMHTCHSWERSGIWESSQAFRESHSYPYLYIISLQETFRCLSQQALPSSRPAPFLGKLFMDWQCCPLGLGSTGNWASLALRCLCKHWYYGWPGRFPKHPHHSYYSVSSSWQPTKSFARWRTRDMEKVTSPQDMCLVRRTPAAQTSADQTLRAQTFWAFLNNHPQISVSSSMNRQSLNLYAHNNIWSITGRISRIPIANSYTFPTSRMLINIKPQRKK